MKVSIIIINFNGEKNTRECLKSLDNLIVKDYELEVIIVDNGSTNKFQISNFKFQIGKIKVIRSDENLGFAGGNNLGIKYALEKKSDYLLILNNDTFVEKNLINELLNISASSEKIGIVVPKIYFAKGYEFHKKRYQEKELGKVIWYAGGIMDWKNFIIYHKGVDEVDNGKYENNQETDFATGCCMFIKKQVIENVGLFDEKFFLYYEDGDFSERVRKAGYKIEFAAKAIIWHKNAGSAGGSGSSLQDYYITRNRILFGMKYAPIKIKLLLIKEGIKLGFNGRFWQKKGIYDFFICRFGKGNYSI